MWRRFDWLAFLAMVLLVITGCVMIYSAYERTMPSAHELTWDNTVVRQAVFGCVGLVVYFVAAFVDYEIWLRLYRWIYAFILLILITTLILGGSRFGAQSWFQFERFDVQASELCKVLMILVLARVLGRPDRELESPLPMLRSVALVVFPTLLIYLQPDFGTALILAATCAGVVYLSGVRWRHMLLVLIPLAAAVPLVWFSLEPYMQDRVLAFFMPSADTSGDTYNVNQALISIGAGGWWGRGLFKGTQTQLHFLRVRHTDFIFSVLAEELGFVGSIVLIGLFCLLIVCLVRTALRARDPGGRLIAGGVAAMILLQVFINIGMNANILPVTGLPLPLVSYGGSSLVTTMLALGLAQSVALQRSLPEPLLPYSTVRGRIR